MRRGRGAWSCFWFWLAVVLGELFEREEGSIVYLGHTLHLVGLGYGGLGNLWRFPRLGILPSWLGGKPTRLSRGVF